MVVSVHPHWCGEHGWPQAFVHNHAGSSPLVWGTLAHGVAARVDRRFIPTGVGNIYGHQNYAAQAPVHPHWCGEHGRFKAGMACCGGSSPLVWGTFAAGQESCV